MASAEDIQRQLEALAISDDARQGLRAALREGRRCGFAAMRFAGVTFFTSQLGAHDPEQPRQPVPSPSKKTRPRRRTPARKLKEAAARRERRAAHRFALWA